MRILYLHCFSGISGDMTIGALVDAGADRQYVEEELNKLPIDPFSIEWKRVNKSGISALKFEVIPDSAHPPKHHRHYADITEMIRKANLSEKVTAMSLAIFEKIGRAEAKIHGVALERVHFHEVGAIDSIVDIVGSALAIDSLQLDKIIASPIALGTGNVSCDHGQYPVPAPATLEMMRGIPILQSDLPYELTTPTGAGIIAGIAEGFSEGLPAMITDAIGYGAGTRDLPRQPNVLRAVVGTADWNKLLRHRHLPSFTPAHEPHSHDHHDHHSGDQ